MKQGNPRCPLSSGPGQGPCSRVFVLVLHGGCAYPSTEMGAGMTNEDHTAPPQDRPLTVHGLKQPSPESCHPESPLLLSTEDGEPWDSALQGSLPRTSPRTPQVLGSLPVHHKSMETLEQRSPHERSFIPASRVSMAIVYLYSKSRDTSKQGGRPGGHSPKPAPARHAPTPSTSTGTTPAWIPLTRPDRALFLSVACYVGDMQSHPQKVPQPLSLSTINSQ